MQSTEEEPFEVGKDKQYVLGNKDVAWRGSGYLYETESGTEQRLLYCHNQQIWQPRFELRMIISCTHHKNTNGGDL